MFSGNRIKLHYALGILVTMSVVWTAIFSWYTSVNALKNSLTEKYLDGNQNYAKKLSISTSDLLKNMQQNLFVIGQSMGKAPYHQEDLDAWRAANGSYFDSLFIIDKTGATQLMSPSDGKKMGTAGNKILSETINKSSKLQKPLISEPYDAESGQRTLFISAPIFDKSGIYQGLVGGTLNLESENVIMNMLKKHQYEDGSYVFVVDKKGRTIFHPNKNMMNENVIKNIVVQKVLGGKNGAAQVVNTEGKEFFAGYAYEHNSGWGIVCQTPITVIDKPLQDLLKNMIMKDLPLLLVILLVAWIFANKLTKPLNQLAKYSEEAFYAKKLVPFKNLNIDTNIYEVHYLYHHMNNYLNLLNRQIQIDGLTGILNRKSFDSMVKEWVDSKQPFTLILLDIDFFKVVNDTYGHLVGDEVLKYLATMICTVPQEKEFYCFRYGGEEFVILLKNNDVEKAVEMAEHLRKEIAKTQSPTGKPITVSLGVTSLHQDDKFPWAVIERADQALYESKTNGRNRTTSIKKKNIQIV